MSRYEYKVVPAPEKAPRVKGLKGADRFAHAVETVMNEMGAEGWSYVRADTLPQEERSGLTSKQTVYRNLLVFARAMPDAVAAADETHAIAAPTEDRDQQADLETPVAARQDEPDTGDDPDPQDDADQNDESLAPVANGSTAHDTDRPQQSA